MYLAQAPRTPGVHVAANADLSPDAVRANLERIGWAPDAFGAPSIDAAVKERRTHISDDWQKLAAHPAIDVVVEATGNPPATVEHILGAIGEGKHAVNVTVEADAFCGPVLAERAAAAGVVYSLAYGDQPAIVCELVDWARAAGFPVVAAGRGHKWQPHFAQSTPDTVWNYWGLSAEQARLGGLNPKMFNSFLDGSKPTIESTAICNATGLTSDWSWESRWLLWRCGVSLPGVPPDFGPMLLPRPSGIWKREKFSTAREATRCAGALPPRMTHWQPAGCRSAWRTA